MRRQECLPLRADLPSADTRAAAGLRRAVSDSVRAAACQVYRPEADDRNASLRGLVKRALVRGGEKNTRAEVQLISRKLYDTRRKCDMKTQRIHQKFTKSLAVNINSDIFHNLIA